MTRSCFRRVIGALLAILALTGLPSLPAAAQGVDAILKRGKIIVGIDLAVPPFGLQDQSFKPTGSEVETAQLLAKDLGVELEIVPTTAQNRIPYLVTNRVDLIMATFAISPERAKSVWFSTPYGATGSVLMAPKGLAIKSYAELAGKKVSVARGSFTEQSLVREAPSTTQIVRFDDDASATAAMVAGQVDAYGTAMPIALDLIKRFPDKQFEVKFSMLTAWYSIGLKRGDSDLLQWVNSFLFFHLQNGDLAKIYEKWIGIPLPPVPTL
ncbi:MAG: transporter substrate-binding domain-containing protein [Alphaproteobacteria bacterium]|nr:transporter substrate-binding domain-containing protein [Alphaproteobacteria bacterium]